MADPIQVEFEALGQQEFVGKLDEVKTGLEGVGTGGEKAAEGTKKQEDAAKTATKPTKGYAKALAKVGAAIGGIAGVKAGLKNVVDTSTALTKATMKLSRTTGMDTETAGAWSQMAKVRGIETDNLNKGFVQLSRQMDRASAGSKQSAEMFKSLGVSYKDVKAGNTPKVLMDIADAFQVMKNPAQQAAVAQQLFGRQGQALLPMLKGGSEGIQKNIEMYEKYFPTVGKNVQETAKMVAQQREMKYAMDGMKVTLGQSLMPLMLKFVDAITKLVTKLNPFVKDVEKVTGAFQVLIGVISGSKAAAAAVWVLNKAFKALKLAVPGGKILLVIKAVIIGLTTLYAKCEWFRNAVNAVWGAIKTAFEATWNFIKDNWKTIGAILLGPLGPAVVAVVKNFDKIKQAMQDVWNYAKKLPSKIAGTFKDLGEKITGSITEGISKAPEALGQAIVSLMPSKLEEPVAKALGVTPRAMGGVVAPGELTLVGEKGPEIAQFPGGTRIHPSISTSPSTTTAHFYLDRRLIATAVAGDVSDRKARR